MKEKDKCGRHTKRSKSKNKFRNFVYAPGAGFDYVKASLALITLFKSDTFM